MDLFSKALKVFGVNKQLDMLQEECGELIVAVNHFRRGRIDDGCNSLINEIVDVDIMLEQMKRLIDKSVYESIKREKLERLSMAIYKREK